MKLVRRSDQPSDHLAIICNKSFMMSSRIVLDRATNALDTAQTFLGIVHHWLTIVN